MDTNTVQMVKCGAMLMKDETPLFSSLECMYTPLKYLL